MMASLVKRLLLITCCWLAGMPQTQALAGVVYRWVDPNGVTHFSETPPPDPAVQPAMIELSPPPPPPPDYDDYYSVVRQAERMERRRLENEKLEAERRQAEAEAMRARIEAQAAMQTPDTNSERISDTCRFIPATRAMDPGMATNPGAPAIARTGPGIGLISPGTGRDSPAARDRGTAPDRHGVASSAPFRPGTDITRRSPVLYRERDPCLMLITIATFTNPLEAHIVRGRLQAEGIETYVAHEHHIWANWFLSTALGGVKLQVRPEDAQQAGEILRQEQAGDFDTLVADAD